MKVNFGLYSGVALHMWAHGLIELVLIELSTIDGNNGI